MRLAKDRLHPRRAYARDSKQSAKKAGGASLKAADASHSRLRGCTITPAERKHGIPLLMWAGDEAAQVER
jgi:hypothetical protein